MCSATTTVPQYESTMWAASVPLDDLAHAIKTAVGVQPVRQLPPPALLKLVEQQQQQQQLDCCQECSRNDSPAQQSPSGCSIGDCLQMQAPLPIRRPTVAEIRAASPTSTAIEDLCRADSGCGSSRSSVSDVDSTCAQLLFTQQHQWQQLSEPASPVFYDNMDDLQNQLQDCFHLYNSSNCCYEAVQPEQDNSCSYLEISSGKHADWNACSTTQLQQQKELLCRVWSESQLPVQPQQQELQHQQQQQEHTSADASVLLDSTNAVRPGVSSCSGSRCCSIHAWDARAAAPAAQDIAVVSSSCGSSESLPTVDDATDAASCRSSVSSSCSGRSQRRVSWGTVTEYQLPPEPQSSIWDCLPGWLQPKHAAVDGSRPLSVSVCTAAGVAVAVVGTAACVYGRRSSSS